MRALAAAAALLVLAALAVVLPRRSMNANVAAFLALIRQAESGGDYGVIAGGDHFTDFREHPFVLDWERRRPLGTTASGAYQMVRGTWLLARDSLGLTDFSPASQDAAAVWILKFKVPGQNAVKPEGTGIFELVQAGRFDEAVELLRPEWEAFERMARGGYHISLDDARRFFQSQGGVLA